VEVQILSSAPFTYSHTVGTQACRTVGKLVHSSRMRPMVVLNEQWKVDKENALVGTVINAQPTEDDLRDDWVEVILTYPGPTASTTMACVPPGSPPLTVNVSVPSTLIDVFCVCATSPSMRSR
jgi:hypothetical protein